MELPGRCHLAPLRLKLGIPQGPLGNFTIVGQSAFGTPVANQLNTFSTRITVAAATFWALRGERPSLWPEHRGQRVWTGGPADQQPGTSSNTYTPTPGGLDVSALLEPDADNDGFGDEPGLRPADRST